MNRSGKKAHLARAIFLLGPTLVLSFLLLSMAARYFAFVQVQTALLQTVFMGLGMLAATFFYAKRFCFSTTFPLLLLLFYLLYQGIDRFTLGEFDSFYYSVQLLLFSTLFSAGWFIAWAFHRKARFPIVMASVFFLVGVLLSAKQTDVTLGSLLALFMPLVFYAFYIIYTARLISSLEQEKNGFWWYLIRRSAFFGFLVMLLAIGVTYTMRTELEELIANYGAGKDNDKDSMLKKNKDGTFNLNDFTRLRGSFSRSNELLFVAKIDNYFEEGTPNPLYLTGFYYSKYDTATETFEPDTLLPYNDLFRPNPGNVPLYFTQTDSAVLQDALQHKGMKTVNIEVYKSKLSADEFVAPTTAYFVQPIAVDAQDKEMFQSAYRAKSYVSELNSAYFVYNPGLVPMLHAFQEARVALLRNDNDYSRLPQDFLRYYTQLPEDKRFEPIRELAHELTQGQQATIDKVIAIRDYFLSKDDEGKPLFRYSDNPGIPDIPSLSKLNYFLFENRKGYCAYYAGATLFMLRALGIPSRIVAGFLTQDRSAGNNKGWYWYYADQAHAWVQVYFPGYGWLDFDTTVGNEEGRNAPQPDGTPPGAPGDATLVAKGHLIAIDTIEKFATIRAANLLLRDKVLQWDTLNLQLDLSRAIIQSDSSMLPLSALKPGDTVTAISFDTVYKQVAIASPEQMSVLPQPAPIDELHLQTPPRQKQSVAPSEQDQERRPQWFRLLRALLFVALALILVFFCLPILYAAYLRWRMAWHKSERQKVFWRYKYTQYYLYQMGYERGEQTALTYAHAVDKSLAVDYAYFIKLYLKLKYAPEPLSAAEADFMHAFIPRLRKQMRKQISIWRRCALWLNPLRTFAFIRQFREH